MQSDIIACVTGTDSFLNRFRTNDDCHTPYMLTLSGEQIPTKARYQYLHTSVFNEYNFLCPNA